MWPAQGCLVLLNLSSAFWFATEVRTGELVSFSLLQSNGTVLESHSVYICAPTLSIMRHLNANTSLRSRRASQCCTVLPSGRLSGCLTLCQLHVLFSMSPVEDFSCSDQTLSSGLGAKWQSLMTPEQSHSMQSALRSQSCPSAGSDQLSLGQLWGWWACYSFFSCSGLDCGKTNKQTNKPSFLQRFLLTLVV